MTAMLDLSETEQSLDKILRFLDPCLPLGNAHATDFFTRNHWDTLVQRGMKEELLALSNDQLKNLSELSSQHNRTFEQDECRFSGSAAHAKESVYSSNQSKDLKLSEEIASYSHTRCNIKNQLLPLHTDTVRNSSQKNGDSNKNNKTQVPYSSLTDFIKDATLCSIEGLGLAITPQELMCNIRSQGNEIFVGTFMSQKKSHEVEIMSRICESLAKHLKCSLVVDFGSGKGYLGNHLSLQYQIPVLGIDASQINTQSAERRKTVIDKQWGGLARNKTLQAQGIKLSKKEKKKRKENLKKSEQAGREDVREDMAESKAHSDSTKLESVPETSNQSKLVIDRKPDGLGKGFEKNSLFDIPCVNGTKENVNNCKFVPCTTFIDKDTNFIEFAKLYFPELFEKKINDGDEEESVDTLSGELSDFVDVTDKEKIREDLSDADNLISDLYLGEETRLLPNKDDNYLFCTENTDKDEVKDENISDKFVIDNLNQLQPLEVCNDNKDQFNIMLTGLHTCGNLASTSLEVFVNSEELKVLCSVGCCYHLLDEKYLDETSDQSTDVSQSGFPLSGFLTQRRVKLGNTARNLASQSLQRMSDFDKLQGERFYPRAVLEVLIQDVCGPDGVVMKGMRKLEQKCASTQQYIRKACERLGISDKVSDEMIESYTCKYQHDQHRLAAFFQLKTLLAPCIESLIILDRVCFLLEQKQVKDVFLVKMFDPVISPRCYGIVAIK